MRDNAVVVRRGELGYIYGSVPAEEGTTTISSQPTLTLYDTSGGVVAGYNAINTTGYNNTALAEPEAWTAFDPLAGAVAAGLYIAVTHIPHTASDGLARKARPSCLVLVLEAHQ